MIIHANECAHSDRQHDRSETSSSGLSPLLQMNQGQSHPQENHQQPGSGQPRNRELPKQVRTGEERRGKPRHSRIEQSPRNAKQQEHRDKKQGLIENSNPPVG